jgi:hypothetical protein
MIEKRVTFLGILLKEIVLHEWLRNKDEVMFSLSMVINFEFFHEGTFFYSQGV